MFSSPFISPYSGGGNPFFCRPRQQPQYPREQYIDPFFSSLFSNMGVPTPARAPACRHSTANLRSPTPARQLHRPQSTTNMRAPGTGAGPARQSPAAQSPRNPQNTKINQRPSPPVAKQPKPQAAKKEPQYKTYETEELYHILASLPEGTDKKSIDVRFMDDDMLVISGDVETEAEIETETETETETEDESEDDESEDDSDVESEVESESESDIEAETEEETGMDTKSLQPYVEDVDDIDDPRTPRAKASLQIRRGSCSSASSRSSTSSTNSANSANSARPLANNKTQAKTSTSQLSKIQRTPKSSTPKRNTKQIKKQTTTEQFSKKFQFPRPVEMRGVKARLEGDRLEIMVPKKRMVRVPSRMWYV